MNTLNPFAIDLGATSGRGIIDSLLGQLLVAGEVADLGQARAFVRASFEPKIYTPTADRGA